MGIPLIKGRDFSAQDNREGVPVTIINEAMAEKMFPGRDPLGKRIRSWRDENMLREIVGVVGNVARYSIDDEVRSTVYVPFEQGNWTLQGLTIRTSSDPQTLASTIRSEVWSLDPNLPVTRIETMEERLAATMEGERFNMLLLGLFAIVALMLAAIGIYGLLSYSVTQRSHEIGIRMALGAERTDVLRGVIRQGLVLTLIGVGTGLGLALALTRVLSNLLFEVSAAVSGRNDDTLNILPFRAWASKLGKRRSCFFSDRETASPRRRAERRGNRVHGVRLNDIGLSRLLLDECRT
jgi:putative ABC transport system permease protein